MRAGIRVFDHAAHKKRSPKQGDGNTLRYTPFADVLQLIKKDPLNKGTETLL